VWITYTVIANSKGYFGFMARTIGIGRQDFEKIRKSNNFYVDKTKFIKEWWEELFEGLSIWEEKTY
jgi:hypothetical protein